MTPTGTLLVPLLLLAVACAPIGTSSPEKSRVGHSQRPPSGHEELPIWPLDALANTDKSFTLLRSPNGASFVIETARAKLIHAVALKMAAAAGPGEEPDWQLVGTFSVNAAARYVNSRPVVVITLGMVELLKNDEGAWGALIGHELAHFRLQHHQLRHSRSDIVDLGASVAGLLLSAAGLSVGSLAAEATGTLVERSFSRDDEYQADRAGLEYAKRAGLDPQGVLRLQERLLTVERQSVLGFLNTHPSGHNRVEALRQMLEQQDTESAKSEQR